MKKNSVRANDFASLQKSRNSATYAPLSKSVCAAMLAGAMVLGGGVFVSPAYADGYVDGTGNNIYYGFKTDAQYAEAHFNIDVEYYDTFEHARDGGTIGIDPLGRFVRVHYLSNCHNNATADEWKFRPMWWFGVPAGLKDPQYIHFKRIEKLTQVGNQKIKPAGSSQQVTTDANGYGAVSDRHYSSTKEWSNLSNFYFSGDNIATKGWKQLVGLGDGNNSKTYDNAGDTEKQWDIYKQDTQGLKGIFVDWESAGQRWYDMTYVSEMEETTWKNRDTNPLRFAAGVYRFAGNWHYAAGQKHDTPKIANHFNLVYPEVTKVKKTNDLSDAEQKAIKEKIENANANTKYYKELVADNGVVVNKDGSATITFKDKTTRTIPASLLVTKDETDKDKYKPVMPDRTPVVKPSKLTDEDKKTVLAAFKKANEKNTDFNDNVKADPDGIKFDEKGEKLVITYKDDSKLEIPASELVYQGATIADWAPYVVPDYIQVDNLKKLSDADVTNIIKAFDDANNGITPYDDAKNGNGNKAPVTVDKATGNATITWEDGSTTTIAAWQFLKEKPKQNPDPSTPTQQGDKTFIVEAPKDQKNVNFDPFNAKDTDLTDANNIKSLNSIKEVLKKCAAKDAKDNKTPVTIKDVEFKIADGKGVVVFHADNYKDATYPMSVFLKQMANKQTPKETEHNPQGMTQYKYKVKPVEYEGTTASVQDWMKALKQFVKSNYGTDLTNDAKVTESYSLKEGDNPVSGTSGLTRYVNGQNKNAGIVTISLSTNPNDGSLVVQGFETGDTTMKTLFTVPAKELYVKKGVATDHTLSDLKQQAKDLLKKRTDEGLTKDDLKRAGITDADTLDENAINKKNEKQLRDLIAKLTDAKKAERKYNEPGVVEFDKGATDDAKFKAAVKAFLEANYTNPEVVTDDNIKSPLTLPTTLKAKTDTVYMGIDADGIKSLSKDASNNIVVTPSKGDAFTVKVTYKQKEDKPAPSAGELKKLKKQAKELIDRNPKLTDDQKTDYEGQIEKATTKEQIQEILKKANEQAGKNNVNPNDIKKKEKEEKEKREKEQKEKEEKEREKKQKQQLQDDKKKASDQIANLNNLTPDEKNKLKEQINGTGTGQDPDGAKTPEDVQKILEKAKAINDAKGALQNDIAKGALPFLDHGNAGDDKKGETSHADDVALHELLGGTSGKDQTLTDLEDALKATDATAESINNALAKAKLQNTSNEQNAKIAGIAKLEAKKAELDAAYNALTEDQKKSAKDKYNAAITAITNAESAVNKATKPSDITTAVNGVDTSLNTAKEVIKNNTPQRDTTQNTYDNQSELDKEKEAQKKRINDSNLPDADKQNAIKDINDAKKIGDPTGIANRYLKAQKIEDAKKQIAALEHLNKAQKKYYEDLLDSTDASDHADGKDDIDDALKQAKDTDTAMKFLGELKQKAEDFKTTDKYTGATDTKKKDAFDKALKAAEDVLKKETGDPKSSVEVNELYKDLLQKMKDLGTTDAGATVDSTDLKTEIDKENTVKASEGYKYSDQTKQNAYTTALSTAKTVLAEAQGDLSKKSLEELQQLQQEVDDALAKLKEAEAALDGHAPTPTPTPSVDKSHLQQGINGSGDVKKSDDYNNAPSDKKQAYDHALDHANEVNKDPNATQDQVNQAAEDLKKAENDLKPTPTPSVDKSGLQKEIGNEPNVKNSDEYNNAPSDKKQAYDHALDHANEVNNNPNATQDQVNQAAEDLKKAEHDLKPAPTPSVDKSHLQQGINGSDDVHNSDDYTNAPSDKKQAYDHALDHANEVNKDPNATQDQVNQAAEDLKNAQKDLHDSATVDKSHLQSEVSDDVAFRDRGSYLVADAPHKDAYNAALSEARRVLADPNATQAQVNAALSKLREAKRNILQANGLSGDEYAGDGNTGTSNTGSETGTGNTGIGNTGSTPGTGNTGTGDFGFGNTGTVPGSGVVPGTVPGSGDSGFGSTGTSNAGTSNAGTSNTGTNNSGVAGSGHEGDSSLGFGVNDNAPTTVDKGELNLQIQGAESDSQSANAGNAGANSGNAGSSNAANAGNAGSNNAANAGNAAANAGNAGSNNAGNAGANAAANNNAAVTAAVENNPAVKQADAQVAAAQAALDSALAEAKKVAADHNATQAQVDAAKRKLADARKNLADAQAHAAQVRASVRAQVLKSGKVAQLSNTGSAVSALSTFAATIAAAGAALFVSKRRGTSRHSSK